MLFYYAECRILFSIMLNDIMLSVLMLNVVMLSVVAPQKWAEESTFSTATKSDFLSIKEAFDFSLNRLIWLNRL